MLIPTWAASSNSGISPTVSVVPSKKPTGPEFLLVAGTVRYAG